MRAKKRIAILAVLMLAACLAGAARVSTRARATLPPEAARVDINQASVEELLKLPGMTRIWAERIVRFRPYRTRRDLIDQGVVSAEVYGHIEDFIIAHRKAQ